MYNDAQSQNELLQQTVAGFTDVEYMYIQNGTGINQFQVSWIHSNLPYREDIGTIAGMRLRAC